MENPENAGLDGAAHTIWLAGEVAGWVREGLVGPDAARMILARYGLVEGGESPRSLRQTRIAQLVGALGAVLVGVGVLVVFGANWEEIPRVARLILLLATMLAAYGGGYRLAYGGGAYPGLGKALILVGSLVWVASLFLVAQMFHLGGSRDPEYARGLLYGALGLFPLAYALRSPTQLAAALAVGCAWALVGGGWWDVGPVELWCILLMLGGLLYAAGLAHRLWPARDVLAPTYTKFGIGLAAVALYAMTLSGFMGWSPPGPVHARQMALCGAIAAVGLAAASWYAVRAGRAGDRAGIVEAAACAVVLMLAAVALFFTLGHASRNYAAVVVIGANVALLGLEVGCVWVGWHRAQPGLINAGLVIFFIHLMTRYFDLFAAMLPSGLAFIGAGALLLLAAFGLERQRRLLLRSMQAGTLHAEGGAA